MFWGFLASPSRKQLLPRSSDRNPSESSCLPTASPKTHFIALQGFGGFSIQTGTGKRSKFWTTRCWAARSNQGSVNGGFQTVVRVLWGNEIPLPPFYLNSTPFLPQFYLILTPFLPQFLPQSWEEDKRATTNVQHRFVQFFLLSFLLFCSPWAKALCFEGESPGGKIMKMCEKVRKIMKNYCPLVVAL